MKTSTYFFTCDCCHLECLINTEGKTNRPTVVRHCPGSRGIEIDGSIVRLQERRGAWWIDATRWIDDAA